MTTPTDEQEAGTMDVSRQLETYHALLVALRFVVLALIVAVTFLILTFCTGAGVVGAAFVAGLLLVIGLYFARERGKVSWASQVATLVMSTAAESDHPIERRLAGRRRR